MAGPAFRENGSSIRSLRNITPSEEVPLSMQKLFILVRHDILATTESTEPVYEHVEPLCGDNVTRSLREDGEVERRNPRSIHQSMHGHDDGL